MLHVFSINVVKVEKVWPARFSRRLFLWDGVVCKFAAAHHPPSQGWPSLWLVLQCSVQERAEVFHEFSHLIVGARKPDRPQGKQCQIANCRRIIGFWTRSPLPKLRSCLSRPYRVCGPDSTGLRRSTCSPHAHSLLVGRPTGQGLRSSIPHPHGQIPPSPRCPSWLHPASLPRPFVRDGGQRQTVAGSRRALNQGRLLLSSKGERFLSLLSCVRIRDDLTYCRSGAVCARHRQQAWHAVPWHGTLSMNGQRVPLGGSLVLPLENGACIFQLSSPPLEIPCCLLLG
jgi:hypothetical protein